MNLCQNMPHLKTALLSRYLGFYKDLVKSPKLTIRFLARLNEDDMRTVSSRTLNYLVEACGSVKGTWNELSSRRIRSSVKYMSEAEEWRSYLGKELLDIRQGNHKVQGFSTDEVEDIFNFVCTE